MPEYLAPGVYIEETSFRAKSIEGVSTSTAGFIGPARYGPTSGQPELLTSFADFERYFGGLDDLEPDGGAPQPNYLAHAARAFFEEGGQRLYVTRVFHYASATGEYAETIRADLPGVPIPLDHAYRANLESPAIVSGSLVDSGPLTLVARFPGRAGDVLARFVLNAGASAFVPPTSLSSATLTRLQDGDLVHVRWRVAATDTTPAGPWLNQGAHGVPTDGLFAARLDRQTGTWTLAGQPGAALTPDSLVVAGRQIEVRPLTVSVEVQRPLGQPDGQSIFEPSELLGQFGTHPAHPDALLARFAKQPPTRFLQLTTPFAILPPDYSGQTDDQQAIALLQDLLGGDPLQTLIEDETIPERGVAPEHTRAARRRVEYPLTHGDDGGVPTSFEYDGDALGYRDFAVNPLDWPKNGLLSFEGVEDISIVAAPGYSAGTNPDEVFGIQNAVINHCERMRYRVAVLDCPPNQLVSGALDFRNKRSSKYAALYYPWITVPDLFGTGRLSLPPSGFVSGIYARNDVQHAVFKAPANEVVRSAIDFELRLTKGQQDVLNPDGVNCFRYFPGHGFLLWGARTISDDPEWKYVNVRRYFAYLEHSIDRGTQWVVFENNSDQLWANVRRTVEDFLLNEWKMGGLVGTKPEEAYFVRCDRSTMTQNDLDNGRLICLIGVAPVKPAEFVIFRIGQWTATARV